MNKKREWVKNAAIIFLAVMLVLTFFSNTIMNYSLPEVSAQYVDGGTLSEQIRGSGVVEANQIYDITIDETRTISSVEVKEGDVVEKDQVLFRLEDSESAELEAAQKELRAAQKAYDEALISEGYDYSLDELDIEKKEENLQTLKEELSEIPENNDDIEALIKTLESEKKDHEREIKNCNDALTAIEAKEYTSLDESIYNKISTALSKVEREEKNKSNTEEKIKEIEESMAGGGSAEEVAAAEKNVADIVNQINNVQSQITQLMIYPPEKQEDYMSQLGQLQNQLSGLNNDLSYAQKMYNSAVEKSSKYNSNSQQLDSYKKTLKTNETNLSKFQKSFDNIIAEVKNEQKDRISELEDAVEIIDEQIEEANKTIEETGDRSAKEKEIKEAENALEVAKLTLEQKKKDDAVQVSKNNLMLKDLLASVEDAEKNVEKFESRSIGAEITAKVGGKITSLPYSAGETAEMGTVVASIEMSEKGYTLEFPVTMEQARKVSVGDEAEIQYFLYGDAKAVLTSIDTDKDNPSQRKILKFAVTGDITPGQNLQLAMGSKGQRYDYIVPKSAVREDSNGKFVLAVVAKSSPLGNRYVAERIDVNVLASDDTRSAVSGGFIGSEFIISTSTKPIEPGMQVRLVDQ